MFGSTKTSFLLERARIRPETVSSTERTTINSRKSLHKNSKSRLEINHQTATEMKTYRSSSHNRPPSSYPLLCQSESNPLSLKPQRTRHSTGSFAKRLKPSNRRSNRNSTFRCFRKPITRKRLRGSTLRCITGCARSSWRER